MNTDLTNNSSLVLTIDNLWVLIAAALVFFMQAGFKVLETGLVKNKHRDGIGIKNLIDWVAGTIAFFLIGFGLMFGGSDHGFFGSEFFFTDGLTGNQLIFFLFQLAFAGTALTIVSGAMSGRTALMPYFITSLVTAMVIYPIFGHWAWGNLLVTDNQPWLANLGFMDFAGSTVVHSVGAWVALTGIWFVGPRLGRYNAQGKMLPVKASDYAYSILGVMILWLGWWGFNGGSTLAFNQSVAGIILNTNISAAFAAFSSFFHAYIIQGKKDLIEKLIGGTLTGLVAITACCNVVTPLDSVAIGLLAGVIHNYFYTVIGEKWKLDDPVGAITVHGIGGIFGTLCVALFGQEELLAHSRWIQLGVQSLGIVVCLFFTCTVSVVVFFTVRRFIGLRVSPLSEKHGAFYDNGNTLDIESTQEHTVSQISIKVSDRGFNLYTVPEYLAMPSDERLKMIKENRVQYLDENGNMLPSLSAVRQLALQLESDRDAIKLEKDVLEFEKSIFNDEMFTAGSIQEAILGDENRLKELFPNSLLLFKPKDIIANDFYWFGKERGYKILVMSDSGEKGIAGAFLTSIGISLLNQIVHTNHVAPPEQILQNMEDQMAITLQTASAKRREELKLGLAIVVVNERINRVYFASAGVDLFQVSGEVTIIKGSEHSLGYNGQASKNPARKTIAYQSGDTFYLATAGLFNQTNGKQVKLGQPGFVKWLKQLSSGPLADQKDALYKEFEKWKGNEPQASDVLVIGIRP